MINNIGRSKFQNRITGLGRFSGMRLSFRDFRVLYDSWFTVFEDYKTDRFVWGTFSDYFCCYIEVFEERVAYERWVCNTDKTVVYAVSVDILNASFFEISED